jgi:hypothetical protein
MGGWEEEAWYARFQVAALLERSQAPTSEIIDAYLGAFDARPARAEPLCELARHLRVAGRYGSAYVHARMAAEIPMPADLLFIDLSVYRWRARDERAVSAFYLGRRAECAALCRELLADPALPLAEHARVTANLALSV